MHTFKDTLGAVQLHVEAFFFRIFPRSWGAPFCKLYSARPPAMCSLAAGRKYGIRPLYRRSGQSGVQFDPAP